MTQEIKGLGPSVRIDLAHEKPFRLAGAEVRPATREVRWSGRRETLQPRVMQVLVALCRANGETVTRDDLTESCWDGVIVSEDFINRVISRLRRLAETTGGWSVETITKVGYRIVVDGAGDPATTEGATSPATPERRPDRRGLLIAVGATAGVAVAGGAALLLTRPPARPAAMRERYDQARRTMLVSTAESSAEAIVFLRQLVADDPSYGEAWGALALAYCQARIYAPPAAQAGLALQARSAAQRALQLNPGNADAQAGLAGLIPTFHNWLAAERAYDDILRSHPHQAETLDLRAQLLANVGRVREALAATRAAAVGEPDNAFRQFKVAQALWNCGRLEEADATVDRALQLWPRNVALWFTRFWIYTFSGRADRARLFAADIGARPVGIQQSDFDLCLASARAMETGAAADIELAAQINLRAAPLGAGYTMNALSVLSSLGRLDEAIALSRMFFLRTGALTGQPEFSPDQGLYVSADLQTTRLFAASTTRLRDDTRFLALCRDIGLVDYWRAGGHRPDDPRIHF